MASTLTTFDFALKERYTEKKVESLCFADRPLLGNLKKDEDFQGEGTVVPLIHVNPQGIAGASLATAQGNTTNVVGKKFTLTAGDYFGTVEIGDKVLKASRGNPGAFLQNKAAEVDGLYESMSDSLSIYCFGNGGGSLGRRLSASTNVITLYEAADTVNFEEGMTVVASANDGDDSGDALRSGSTTVASVEREDGTVTLANAAAITSFSNDDYMFRQGDFNGDQSVVIIHGLQSFITSSNSPAALYGMTRTSDPSRLAGVRVASTYTSGKGIEERLQILGAHMTGRHKGPGADAVYMHPEDWQDLAIALQSRGTRPLKDDSTRFGYMALEVVMGGKLAKVYSDRHCPKGTAFALKMGSWTLHSMLKLLHPLNGDGLTMLRKSTTNDYEYRLVSYPALCTNAPGWNGRVAV